MSFHLRIAKPVSDLSLTRQMYCDGLKLSVLGHFENHEGFSGIMLGSEGMHYHFEFTVCEHHRVQPASTVEDLIVFYIENEEKWRETRESMISAGQ